MEPARLKMIVIGSGFFFALLGLVLAIGGIWLAVAGGSWYYIVAALVIMLTGALLVARWIQALWVYAGLVLATLLWALVEVGLDWWQLAPRGGVICLLGLYLLMPWISISTCSNASSMIVPSRTWPSRRITIPV